MREKGNEKEGNNFRDKKFLVKEDKKKKDGGDKIG